MQFSFDYTNESKLNSLSERLRLICNGSNKNKSLYRAAKSENLKYNLPWVIANIIFKLHFLERSKEQFVEVVEQYNKEHGTILSFDDFKTINWIREVHDEVLMPATIKHYIFRIGFNEAENKTPEILPGKADISRCLQNYYKKYFHNTSLTITKNELESVLEDVAPRGLTLNYFDDHELLNYEKLKDLYEWKGLHNQGYLTNEIAASLWLLCAGEDATIAEFKKWFRFISATGMWVDDLTPFLNTANTDKIAGLAYEMSCIEKDFEKSDNEFEKTWLDAYEYRHYSMSQEIPVVEFDYSTSYSFVSCVKFQKRRFHDVFDYQPIRSFSLLLLRLMVYQSRHETVPYSDIRNLLLDTSKPFLLWNTFRQIPKEFPFIIPYLLAESEIAPLVFLQIDKIDIPESIIIKHSDHEKTFEEDCNLRNRWWLEMFELLLEQINNSFSGYDECGEMIGKIMLTTADNTFHSGNNRHQHTLHSSYRKRYDEALKLLINKKVSKYRSYLPPLVNPDLIIQIMPGMVYYLSKWKTNDRRPFNEFIGMPSGYFDLCIELLKYCGQIKSEINGKSVNTPIIQSLENTLVQMLTDYLVNQFSVKNIAVETWGKKSVEKRTVKRRAADFGIEIIDWSFLYIKLFQAGVFKAIEDAFLNNLDINTAAEKYDDDNREQAEKIKLFLKSILLAFNIANQQKQKYISQSLPVENFLKYAETLIASISVKFSSNKLIEGRMDIFDETFTLFDYNQYYEQLDSLLFSSINYFRHTDISSLLISFFESSIHLGRMLSAINILDKPALKALVSNKIKSIQIEDFIQSRFTVTDLEHALIDAVNSDKHWTLAKPLMEKIKKHFEKRQYKEDKTDNLIFQAELLIAFNEKNFDQLKKIHYPNKTGRHYDENYDWVVHTRQFFIALYHLYNDKNYNSAIPILQALAAADEKNIRYHFNLYKARLLKAIKEQNSDAALISQAWLEWQRFADKEEIKDSKSLYELKEQLDSCNLYYYAAIDDEENFERIINRLSNKTRYDDEIVVLTYKYYISRSLYEYGYDYLLKAQEYLAEQGEFIPEIQKLIDSAQSPALIKKLHTSFSRIHTLKPKNLILVLPEILNGKTIVHEFVLQELVNGLKILKDKIQGIKQVTHEDRYTDLLITSLRLRFSIFGWSITGQERTGNSSTGKNAGEPDILIESSGGTITIAEALVLNGGDFSKTSAHLIKCFTYKDYLASYCMITYYNGDKVKFDSTWETYKTDTTKTDFPNNFQLNKTKGFEDIAAEFEVKNGFKIAKTLHSNDIIMFHIMVNV